MKRMARVVIHIGRLVVHGARGFAAEALAGCSSPDVNDVLNRVRDRAYGEHSSEPDVSA